MDYAVCWHFIVPIDSFSDIFPICNITIIYNTCKTFTVSERPPTDRSHAVGDCHAC